MPYFKRFLLLLSISVSLLAGLMVTSHTTGSSTAFANGCNTVATGETPAFQPDWSNNCTVSKGNISNFVSAIQVILNAYGSGCGGLTVDGNFGPATFNAVVCFQRKSGFPLNEQDGIVGPKTWGALASVPIVEGTNGGWDNFSAYGTTFIDFRMWTGSSKIWYVNTAREADPAHWCQMNLSSPC